MVKRKVLPLNESELIISHITGKSREYLLAHPELEITPSQRAKISLLSRRRREGEPMAYLLKNKEFWGLNYYVDRRVLIPRPETEHLVQEALNAASKMSTPLTFIDIGTGSGCIILSLAHSLPNKKYRFMGVDISTPALNVAKKNALKHRLQNKVKFFKSDLLEFILKSKKTAALDKLIGEHLIITANLPYVSEKLFAKASESVTAFEPSLALLSGKDGLDHYRKLFLQINQLLKKNPKYKITLLIEISPQQKNTLSKLITHLLPGCEFSFIKDLASKWRVVKIRNY